MIDPMIARLAGCIVFAGLIGTLITATMAQPARQRSDVVAAAEVQHRTQDLITRP